MRQQQLPYFVGIAGSTAGATGLSMNLVVIPPGGAAEPHIHRGYETAVYLLKGRVETRYGRGLRQSIINQAGDFLFIPADVPHQPVNLSETEPAHAIVARNDANEQENVVLYDPDKDEIDRRLLDDLALCGVAGIARPHCARPRRCFRRLGQGLRSLDMRGWYILNAAETSFMRETTDEMTARTHRQRRRSSSEKVAALIGSGDPSPFELVEPHATRPILLVCDHASRAIPRSLGTLGLDTEALSRHIAWDIGAADLTRRLAEQLGAPAVLAGYSRLVIDLNRQPGDPQSILDVSDGVVVPGNLQLAVEQQEARATVLPLALSPRGRSGVREASPKRAGAAVLLGAYLHADAGRRGPVLESGRAVE